MLSLSLVAARSQLLCSPKPAQCLCFAAHSLRSNMSIRLCKPTQLKLSKSRHFATSNGPTEASDKEKFNDMFHEKREHQSRNDENNPLERLMNSSQQFQLDFDSLCGDDDRAEDVPVSSWQTERNNRSHRASNQPSFKTATVRPANKPVDNSVVGKMAVDHLLEKDLDEIDYDAELEIVWDEEQVKQRKYYQVLRREQDRDFVCTNCGERGHRARNCLVPQICSNCGNLGHKADQCRFRTSPKTIDEFLVQEKEIQEKRKKGQKLRKKAARVAKNPGLPRPKDLPTSDFNKRNDCLRQELDAELEAYAKRLENQAQKRRELKAQESQTSVIG